MKTGDASAAMAEPAPLRGISRAGREMVFFSRSFWKTQFELLLCFPSETQLLSDVARFIRLLRAFETGALSAKEVGMRGGSRQV